ncbi:AraC family transcriptional regulator [Rhodococcus zopfii]|uniref:AraC family transcriptional regulator n=1 Tax=Rhodococcus zopfii TaxID=43772 RepID=UPI00352744EA
MRTDDGRIPGNWEEAEVAVSDAYFPHSLRPLDAITTPRVTLRRVDLGPLRLARVGWGAEVSVESDHPGAYAVNIPLAGQIESVSEGREVVSRHGYASVFRPDTAAAITRWTASCEIVGIKLDRDYLHREMARVLGRPGLQLPPQVDLTTDAGKNWLSMLGAMVGNLESGDSPWTNPVVADQLSGAITSAFVLAVMREADPGTVARPRIIKRVLDRLHADPSLAWTSADMAEVAGVSVRRLQEGFREYLGVCPREYLLDLRLERIHAALSEGDPAAVCVTDVALEWGITHTGRFAAAYRRKYGVAPSDTLRS